MTYDKARAILKEAGYYSELQVTQRNSVITGIRIPVAELLVSEAITHISGVLPSFLVEADEKKDYILVRKNLD